MTLTVILLKKKTLGLQSWTFRLAIIISHLKSFDTLYILWTTRATIIAGSRDSYSINRRGVYPFWRLWASRQNRITINNPQIALTGHLWVLCFGYRVSTRLDDIHLPEIRWYSYMRGYMKGYTAGRISAGGLYMHQHTGQQSVWSKIKENIKTPNYWPFLRRIYQYSVSMLSDHTQDINHISYNPKHLLNLIYFYQLQSTCISRPKSCIFGGVCSSAIIFIAFQGSPVLRRFRYIWKSHEGCGLRIFVAIMQ